MQSNQSHPRRFQPTAVYLLAERLKRAGVQLDRIRGPWRTAKRMLQRPGRNALPLIPVVTNGHTELAVDTMARAIDLSGFLNWCGLAHLTPVPGLIPPREA
jgi:hypothetical protein